MKNSNGNTDRLIENLCYAQGIVDAFAAVLVDQDYHSEDQSLRVLYRCDDAKTAMQEAMGAIRGMREEIRTMRDEQRKTAAKLAMHETLRHGPIDQNGRANIIDDLECECRNLFGTGDGNQGGTGNG